MPLTARLFKGVLPADCIIAVTRKAPSAKIKQFQNKGVRVIVCPAKDGHVDLQMALESTCQRRNHKYSNGGGAHVIGIALKQRLVDKLYHLRGAEDHRRPGRVKRGCRRQYGQCRQIYSAQESHLTQYRSGHFAHRLCLTGSWRKLALWRRLNGGKICRCLKVRARKVLQGTKLGDSIAVEGACLTVTEIRRKISSPSI